MKTVIATALAVLAIGSANAQTYQPGPGWINPSPPVIVCQMVNNVVVCTQR